MVEKNDKKFLFLMVFYSKPEMGTSAVFRVIEQCRFNSVPDPFNGQTVNIILKPQKVIESRTYVEKANLKHYWKTLFYYSDNSTSPQICPEIAEVI